jgi:hypothetical protein
MPALNPATKLQDGMIALVETSQRWTLAALRSTTSAFDTMQPDFSRMPLVKQMPSPGELIDTTFTFAGRLLDAQHAFLLGLLGLSTPPAPPVVAVRPRVVRTAKG